MSNKTKSTEDVGFRGIAWIFDLASKQATKLPLPEADEVDDWSLTGDWLVTVSDRHPPFGHGYQLYVMHPDGTDQRRLTEGGGLNCYPRFQPGTNRIAYHHSGNDFEGLWLVDFDGSNRKQLLSSDQEARRAERRRLVAGWKMARGSPIRLGIQIRRRGKDEEAGVLSGRRLCQRSTGNHCPRWNKPRAVKTRSRRRRELLRATGLAVGRV